MIERVTIDGEEAFAAYLNGKFEPAATKAEATLIKLVFDNGRVMFVYPQDDDGAEAAHRD
jgi:hypothetical protein